MLASALVLAQLAAVAARPVLAFPDPRLDDTVAYAGYTTRFYRDHARNTLQVYLDRREGRVVHVLADGENESLAFTARDSAGGPAALIWEGDTLRTGREGRLRLARYALRAPGPVVQLGRFVLGSMRFERDVQYEGLHRAPFADAPWVLPEFQRLADALERAPAAWRDSALVLLGARDVTALRARLVPVLRPAGRTGVEVVMPSLDARDTLRLRVVPGRGTRAVSAADHAVELRAEDGPVTFTVEVATTGRTLTPLDRRAIFTDDFLRFLEGQRRAADPVRAAWLERQVTGVELLAAREKLMAGLPTYATYFGRDMLMSALMMQAIWRPRMNAFVLDAALRRLAPDGQVSHEEALGGQAMREAAAQVVALLGEADATPDPRAAADRRRRALDVLRTRRATRENYHMIDDEYQLALVASRWLDDARVPAADRLAWLRQPLEGQPRLARLLAALAVVAEQTAPYAQRPEVANLVAFAPRDVTATGLVTRWGSQSWRDSGAGYANGRYPMDVNAIYAPHALAALQRIVGALRALGLAPEALRAALPAARRQGALARYLADEAALGRAVAAWAGAARHFEVVRPPATSAAAMAARLDAMPAAERAGWDARPAATDTVAFAALALDTFGQPIPVANTDPATRLFLDALLGVPGGGAPDEGLLRREAALFARPYPAGLLVPGVGPVVANDAWATADTWRAFDADPYHGPRVVWGREVNLFLLGVAAQLPRLPRDGEAARALRDAAARVREAVRASGFRAELWSYEVRDGVPRPRRYGSGGDVQLWSTTDLAVQYAWERLQR